MTNREIVKQTMALTDEDVHWYPLYPNNLISNGEDGVYTYIYHEDNKGTFSGRKYTIMYQHKLSDKGYSTDEIECYILFEELVNDLDSEPVPVTPKEDSEQLTAEDCSVNEKGSFVRAFTNIEDAKKQALMQYKAIFGYALSFIA